MTEPFNEITSDEPQVTDKIELSARVIHEAYQAYKEALQGQLNAVLERTDGRDVDCVLAKVDCYVKQAQAEVDRVTALTNFFQVESILKASGVI